MHITLDGPINMAERSSELAKRPLFETLTDSIWKRELTRIRRELKMINTYRLRYTHENKSTRIEFQASNPISALNQFHSFLQKERDIPHDKYVLDKFSIYFNANASGLPQMVESYYDIPKTPNPKLVEDKPKSPKETDSMEFFASTEGQGRLAE